MIRKLFKVKSGETEAKVSLWCEKEKQIEKKNENISRKIEN